MDPVTWPAPVLRLAAAITKAEGSNPEWRNPGDLTYSFGFPIAGIANEDGVLKFENAADGEYALYHQCFLMLTGRSHVYKLTDSLTDVGLDYAKGDPNWSANVSKFLGVPPTTTLAELAA